MNTTRFIITLTALLCLIGQARSEVATVNAGSYVVDRYFGLNGGKLSSDPVIQSYVKATFDSDAYAKVWTSRSLTGRWNDGSYGNEIDYAIGWNGRLTDTASLDLSATYWDEPAAGSFGAGDILYLKAVGTKSFKSFSIFTSWEQFVPTRGSGLRGGSLIGSGASVSKRFGSDLWNVHARSGGYYDTGIFGNEPALLFKGSVGIDRTISRLTTFTLIAADWWVPICIGTRDARIARATFYTGFSWNWSKR